MAYETKVLLSTLAASISRAETIEEAYSVIVDAANVEGMQIPSYEEAKAKIEEMRKGKK